MEEFNLREFLIKNNSTVRSKFLTENQNQELTSEGGEYNQEDDMAYQLAFQFFLD